jgi:hypothetical protein
MAARTLRRGVLAVGIEDTVQGNHLLLIVEAAAAVARARGLQSLEMRIAKASTRS